MGTHLTLPPAVAPVRQYPLLFVAKPGYGPTFNRIIDSAKYYYDELGGSVPLEFDGWLTNWHNGKSREVTLIANAYGFSSGSGFAKGRMTVDLHLNDYVLRYGGHLVYYFRDKVFERTLELAHRATF